MKTFLQFINEDKPSATHTYGWETKKAGGGYEWNVHKFHLKNKVRKNLADGTADSRIDAVNKAKEEFKKHEKKK